IAGSLPAGGTPIPNVTVDLVPLGAYDELASITAVARTPTRESQHDRHSELDRCGPHRAVASRAAATWREGDMAEARCAVGQGGLACRALSGSARRTRGLLAVAGVGSSATWRRLACPLARHSLRSTSTLCRWSPKLRGWRWLPAMSGSRPVPFC